MELDERKRRILRAIIDSYIETAEPVGSRSLAKYHDLNLSPATIRNEMSDLEEMGFLDQPHTSSGRIPSNVGYRYYVDMLMQKHNLSKMEMENINRALSHREQELERAMARLGHIISDFMNYTAIVAPPKASICVIKKLDLISIDDHHFLLVLVLDNAHVKNRVFSSEKPLDSSMVELFANLLSATVLNRPLGEISWDKILSLEALLPQHSDLIGPILRFAGESIKDFSQDEFFLSGAKKILNHPEYADLTKVRGFFDVLDDRKALQTLLESTTENLKIYIGNENQIVPLDSASVVICQYDAGDGSSGSIGIIGPTRMDYAKIVSNLEYFSSALGQSNILKSPSEDKEEDS